MSKRYVFLIPGHPSPIGGFKLIYLHASILKEFGYQVHLVHVNPWLDKKRYSFLKRLKAYLVFFYMTHFSKWRKFPEVAYGLNARFTNSMKVRFDREVEYVIISWQLLLYYGDRVNYADYYITHLCMDIPGYMGPYSEIINSLRFPIKYVGISKFMMNIFLKYNPQGNIQYLPCVIDEDSVGPSCSKEYDICANLADGIYKNMSYAVNLLNKLCKTYKVITFGRLERPKNLAKQVVYVRGPDNQSVAKIYACSNSFVSVSKFEGFGLPGMEAMINKSIVFSTDNGGCLDYCIFGKNSIKLNGNNLHEDYIMIVGTLDDPEFVKSIRKNSADFVSKYKKKFNKKKVVSVYAN
jgi:glycosyltransferase involved in cell wall biosynthesis